MTDTFRKFKKLIPIAKVDDQTHTAYGIVTGEAPDADSTARLTTSRNR